MFISKLILQINESVITYLKENKWHDSMRVIDGLKLINSTSYPSQKPMYQLFEFDLTRFVVYTTTGSLSHRLALLL